ncbi:MAG: hypothetical protein QM695_06830 [Micropruina sp.]
MIERQNGEDPIGPQTFFVAGNTLTVNDYVHNRVTSFRNGQQITSFKAPGLDCCEDLRVDNGVYWLLAGRSVRSYKVSKKKLTLLSTHKLLVNDSTQWPQGTLTREDGNLIANPDEGKGRDH